MGSYGRAYKNAGSLDELRRYAVARTFFQETSLGAAIARVGYVQADPIRAPARAQDLMLRHRVAGYRSGDLDRQYASLQVDEDFFVNYGFLDRSVLALMHPRMSLARATREKRTRELLAYVLAHGEVHPRRVHAHFSHGTVTNYWGGSSNATTHLLDAMHYRGLLRIARREAGVRIYAPREFAAPPAGAATRRVRLDALVDVAVRKYAPLPAPTLAWLVNRLRYGVPQWRRDLPGALVRATRRLAHANVDGMKWYWPPDEEPTSGEAPDRVRLLAPFDPLVWDRRRFEKLWGWGYRLEAYTPAAKRKFGYYALPLLWRDHVIGWANVAVEGGQTHASVGYVAGRPPRERAFTRALDAEIEELRRFLEREPTREGAS